MFKRIKQGLEIYEQAVKDYLRIWGRINDRVDRERLKYGDYTSDRHYKDAELAWKERRTLEISIMEKVLGIDEDEKEEISDEISQRIANTL